MAEEAARLVVKEKVEADLALIWEDAKVDVQTQAAFVEKGFASRLTALDEVASNSELREIFFISPLVLHCNRLLPASAASATQRPANYQQGMRDCFGECPCSNGVFWVVELYGLSFVQPLLPGLPAVPSSPPKRLTQRQSPCCSPVRRGARHSGWS
eukprot:4567966-Amphidinium_carterae.1